MDEGRATQIVIKAEKMKLPLLTPVDGSEVMDYNTHDIQTAFSDYEDYDDKDIELALNGILRDIEEEKVKYLTGKLLKEKLAFYGCSPIPLTPEDEEEQRRGCIVNSRLFKSFGRILHYRQNIMNFLPPDDELVKIAMKYGITPNELNAKGGYYAGNKRLLQSFYAEWKVCQKVGVKFGYRLGLDKDRLFEWVPDKN